MDTPLVSIVIRTYNRADRIQRALGSALAQDYPHTQMLVIDDGSTDNTREIIAGYPHVSYHYQQNGGVESARFAALPFVQGEFLAYLDSDDEWDTDYLSRSLALFDSEKVGLVFANHRRLFSYDRPGEPSSLEGSALLWPYFEDDPQGAHFLDPQALRALYIRHMPAPSSATVLRRELVCDSWEGHVRISDDWMTVLDMIFRHKTAAAFWARPLWTKWCEADSVADGLHDQVYQTACRTNDRQVMLRNYGRYMTREERRVMIDDIVDHNFSTGYALSNRGRLGAALRHYARAFRFQPKARIALAGVKAVVKKVSGRRTIS